MTDEPGIKKARFPGAHILVVDDERGTRRTLTYTFERMGYQAAGVASGQRALEYLASHEVDLVILDLNMPGMSGVEVLEAARPVGPNTLFVILTAHGTLESAIAGIRHGAFDYLLKPSPMEQIIETVEEGLAEREQRSRQDDPVALLERALHSLKNGSKQEGLHTSTDHAPPRRGEKRFLQAPGVTVDLQRKIVVVRGKAVDLTPTEFDILVCMMEHRSTVLSCREIVAEIRGQEIDERDARMLLRSHIHRLRQKIEQDPAHPSLICTVRGEGYIFATQEQAYVESPNALA